MKKFLVALAVLAMLSVASAAIVLEISFGDGITHNVSNISATMGAPSTSTRYYFTSTTPFASTSASSATVVSKADVTGTIVFQKISETGTCNWKAIIAGNIVALADLNGHAIAANEEIKWAVEPTSGSTTICRLVMDYNVIST